MKWELLSKQINCLINSVTSSEGPECEGLVAQGGCVWGGGEGGGTVVAKVVTLCKSGAKTLGVSIHLKLKLDIRGL